MPLYDSRTSVSDGGILGLPIHVVDIHVEVAQLRAGRDGVRIEVAQLQRRSARDRQTTYFFLDLFVLASSLRRTEIK
jgi:hypothetical protein